MEQESKRSKSLRDEEKQRLLGQIERGLVDAEKAMKEFRERYAIFISEGGDLDGRLSSWNRFFKGMSLTSEERTDNH